MNSRPEPEAIYKFLLLNLFKDPNEPLTSSINRAYLDFCRTLRKDGSKKGLTAAEARRKGEETLLERIDKLNASTRKDFDDWHKETCGALINDYSSSKYTLTVGQAQKWVNMTMKYLYVLNDEKAISLLLHLHVPIDKFILDAARNEWGIRLETDHSSWSTMDDYDAYLQYQNAIRDEEKYPLKWEFTKWNTAKQIRSKLKL